MPLRFPHCLLVAAWCAATVSGLVEPPQPAPSISPPPTAPATAPAAAAPAPAVAPAAFLPSRHGFHFRNAFTGTPLPPALRRLGIEKQMHLPARYGLCGGMSLAAADFALAGVAVPSDVRPPKEGTALYEYLYRRQSDSLGPLAIMATKFAQWMRLPDTSDTGESTASLTAKELPGILARLGKGELVPLGLVYSKAGEKGNDKIWENHQVLAYRAADSAEGGHDLSIYDPNYPNDDRVVIKVRPVEAAGRGDVFAAVSCLLQDATGRTIRVRGLFAMPYTRATPPDLEAPPK